MVEQKGFELSTPTFRCSSANPKGVRLDYSRGETA
jgi:hypothetical protein